jgi:MerR family transcriptional regulator, heat shock protein HspR
VESRNARYVISVAAKIVEVHPQTLRYYERAGLVEPQRTGGNIRLYSDEDLERVCLIKRLITDLGVNLAGVEVILTMMEKMDQIKHEHEVELEQLKAQYEEEIRKLRAQSQR